MVSATVREIMDDALTIVGEVEGAGVQAYSEDRVRRDAIRAFNLLFKKYYWHQYRKWLRLELDGTTGLVTTDDLRNIVDFEDFMAVRPDGSQKNYPILPRSTNPFGMTGNTVRYWDSLHVTHASYTTRRLQFYPITATGFVNVQARIYPVTNPATDWREQDTMYLDRDMLAYGTAFMTLAHDDLNPGGATVAKEMMEMRFKDIINSLGSHAIPLGRDNGIPTDWTPA